MSKNPNPVKAEDLPYRPCVGVMILSAEGLVWAGRRIPIGNSEYDGSENLWQMPQGGIDEGEDPLEAAYRELYEETGMKTVTLLAEASDWINYDLPPELIGIGLRGSFAARHSAGLPFASMATKARSPSTRHPAATSRNSTSGNGSLWRNCRN